MRAIGFAALSFGAVIALSSTLGMTYRGDAAPLDDPSSASDAPTVSAPADSAPADSAPADDAATAPTDDPAPTDPAPTDTATATPEATDAPDTAPPTDDPEATDSPAPALRSFSFSTLDETPTVSYSFTPLQVTATINDDSADGGTIQLFHHDGTDFVAVGSPRPVSESGDEFSFAVSTGTWNLTTDDYYGNQIDFHQFTVQNAPVISSLTWGSTVHLQGVAATFVPGSVLVSRTDAYHPGPVSCDTDATIDTTTGAWSCDFPAPADMADEYDTAVYQAVEQDYTGGITGFSNAVAYLNPAYISGWSFDSPNSVTAHGFDLSGDADTGSLTYWAANPNGSPAGTAQDMADLTLGGTCTSVPSSAVPVDCSAAFGDARPSGLWAITAAQTDGSYPEVTGPTSYVYIPPAPTLDVRDSGDGIYFSGTGIQGDAVTVFDSSGNDVCDALVGEYYEPSSWYCYPEFGVSADDTFVARQTDAGESTADGIDPAVRITPGGISLASPQGALATLDVDQQLRPAGVDVTVQQGVDSDGTFISFYHFTADDGGEGPVNWYGYASDSWCPAGERGPVSGVNRCTLTGLEPGDYETYVTDAGPAGSFDSWWVVPPAPVITSTVLNSGHSVTLRGTGVSGDAVRVIVDGATNASPACDGTVVVGGTWSCVVPPLASGRTHTIQAYLEDIGVGDPAIGDNDDGATYTSGGISAASTATSVSIAAGGGTTTVPPVPELTTLATWFFNITGIDLNNVHPGDTFTVSGSDLPPGSTVSGELHSKAVSIGSAVVQPDGTFTLPVTVPADFPVGAHTIVMTLTPPGSSAIPSQQPIKVVPASASGGSGDTQQPSDSPSPLGSSEGPGIDNHGPNSNILTHGLNTIADVLAHPAKVPAAIEIGLVLLIFAVLPGHLLNATLAEQYERFAKRRAQRRRAPGWWARLVAFLHRAPFVAGVALTTVTALLFGFADPRFGFSIASLRLFLGLAIALAIVSYLTNAVVGRIMRGRWKVDVEVNLRPLGLILTVVGVVVSRLLDFSPGFLIGLVLGLVISEKHLARHAWRAVLLRTSILLGLSLLAWVAFSLFDAKQEGGTFASELAIETLVAITTEAIVSLLVELLPLRLLEGEKLYQKSKVLWGALYLVAVFIFVVAVVPWEGNWAELGSSLWTWIGIVVGFGIVATGIYLYFRIRSHDEVEHHVDADEDSDKLVPIGSEDE